jgi:MerR family redox-sensitive transcriptional activator SoxR
MEMTIGEAARRAGVEPSTLRYYERLGLLPAPRRVSGWRRYSPEVVRALRLIRVAKEAGFTLAEIHTLVHGFPEEGALAARWKFLARRKLPEVEALIARAQGMRRLLEAGLNCQCLAFEDCVLLFDSERPAQAGASPSSEIFSNQQGGARWARTSS